MTVGLTKMMTDTRKITSFGIQVPEPNKVQSNTTSAKQLNNMYTIDEFGILDFNSVEQKLTLKEEQFGETAETKQARELINSMKDEFYAMQSALVYNKVSAEYDKLGMVVSNLELLSGRDPSSVVVEIDYEKFTKRLKQLLDTDHITKNMYDQAIEALKEYQDITLIKAGEMVTRSINSIVRKAGISPKVNGAYMVQVPDGYRNDNSELSSDFIITGKDSVMVDNGGELKMFEVDMTGKILGMEVMVALPRKYLPFIMSVFGKPFRDLPKEVAKYVSMFHIHLPGVFLP
jgi:hypothetical protein